MSEVSNPSKVCEYCKGVGSISYNPNLNPNAFPATATAKCSHCDGTGSSAKTIKRPPIRRRLVRPLTRRNADRIRVLVDACTTMQTEGKLELMPGSKTFGGSPIAGLTAELNMLLHGFESSTRCKEI